MVREESSVSIRRPLRTGKLFAASTVVFVAAALSAAGLLSSGAPASADDNSGGIGITVTVAPTEAHANPGETGGSGSSGGGSGGSTTPSDSPSVGPSPSATASPGGGNSVGGILFVSGLTTRYIWSANPLHSSAELGLTVRNVSKARFDATARFWVTTTFGSKVSEARKISVRGLKPNETRVIRATLGGLGQWTVLQAHAKFTPPKVVQGIPLSPVTRDAFIVVPPVLVGGLGVGAACVFILLKFLPFPKLFS
jgi:hypothetical protein